MGGKEEVEEVYSLLHGAMGTYHVIEDIPLVDMYSDECFILDPLHLAQVLGGHLNQSVQHLQKVGISLSHHFLVRASTLQGTLSISCPDHLYAQ